jgi:cytochrome c peroxidase
VKLLLHIGLIACLPTFVSADSDFVHRALPFTLDALDDFTPDPSNRFSGDPDAIALGQTLFFDAGFSGDGTVSCATCHVTDGRFVPNESLPARADRKFRTVMPVVGAQFQDFLFWDGRADSLWMQAIGPIENPAEHAMARTDAVAYFLETYGRDVLEAPEDLTLPSNASPIGTADQRVNWAAMDAEDQQVTNQLFADIGKIIAAFEETLLPKPSQWDNWVSAVAENPAAIADIPPDVIAGFDLFTGKARCATCHDGPLFSDLDFHNTGLPALAGSPPDLGRQATVLGLKTDPFNCLGPYSDALPDECPNTRFLSLSAERSVGTFRTPSLRGVVDRGALGHAGQKTSLFDMVRHYNEAPVGPHGAMMGQTSLSELVPLGLTDDEIRALVAFLETL